MRGMRLVHAHVADLMIVGIKDGDLSGCWSICIPISRKMKGTPSGQHWLSGVG